VLQRNQRFDQRRVTADTPPSLDQGFRYVVDIVFVVVDILNRRRGSRSIRIRLRLHTDDEDPIDALNKSPRAHTHFY